MADEPIKTEPTVTEPTKSGKVIFDSQEDFNNVLEGRLRREREKYKDYDTVKSELEKLIQAQKKREEEELTELDKLKKQIEEKESSIEDLQKHKEWHELWELQEAEKVNTAMKELDEETQSLINDLPLEKRFAAINKFKSSETKNPPYSGKGGKNDGVPSVDEVMEIRNKFGGNSQQFLDAMKKRKAQGF